MKLSIAAAQAASVDTNRVMLLRHSSRTVELLLSCGGSIEEYSRVQPTGSKYDYLDEKRGPVNVAVVIVNDCVQAAYRVLGIEAEGTTYSLTSPEHQAFDRRRDKPPREARRFRLEPVAADLVGVRVRGWEGRERTAVQRVSGGFFDEIEIDIPDEAKREADVLAVFEDSVSRA